MELEGEGCTGPAWVMGQEGQGVKGIGEWSVSGAQKRGARATWRPLSMPRADLRASQPCQVFCLCKSREAI